ncbi:hypothetical protein CTI12_AA049790 [Artemisia annua]|uniref:Uncharacterized protein n=1 Tax=Artemisia annua TaxID=35608 RepID=A0A2U1QBA4_ARTAN|nr:hypothetical protein CTI12_AA049790 [Artemisia annua]
MTTDVWCGGIAGLGGHLQAIYQLGKSSQQNSEKSKAIRLASQEQACQILAHGGCLEQPDCAGLYLA